MEGGLVKGSCGLLSPNAFEHPCICTLSFKECTALCLGFFPVKPGELIAAEDVSLIFISILSQLKLRLTFNILYWPSGEVHEDRPKEFITC